MTDQEVLKCISYLTGIAAYVFAVGIALLALCGPSARAALRASEPFGEATGALNNANGGTGWGGNNSPA
jgi:hypothetical protein